MNICSRQRALTRLASVAVGVLCGSLLTAACTSDNAPTPTYPPRGPSLAECRAFGVPYAPVSLKLPRMAQEQIATLRLPNGDGGPRLDVEAVDEGPPLNAFATLYDGPEANTPHRIRNAIKVVNDGETLHWNARVVDEAAITLSSTADTGQATEISHSTFTVGSGSGIGTKTFAFDHWAFTANQHRYLLSYVRPPSAKVPDAATFFATAMSCPTPKPTT